jgi:hypothetical protein
MTIRAMIFCAAFGAAGCLHPCISEAQTAQGDPAQTQTVPKQSEVIDPHRLAPAQYTSTFEAVAPKPPTPAQQPSVSAVEPAQAPVVEGPRSAPAAEEPVAESPPPEAQGSFSTPEQLLEWLYNYSRRPTPWRVPAAVRAMRNLGLFTDEEKAGFCTGFIAGVLGKNPKDGPGLITKMLPMPDKDQAILIRAIAFSGRPDWRELLEKYRSRMPLRHPLIDSYLSGQAKTLMEVDLSDGSPVVYTLWGYYVATGQYQPVVRIIEGLRWSKQKDDGRFSWGKIWSGWKTDPSAVDKITVGATAKWTLASYAERNRDLLDLYRAEYERQPKDIAEPLKDVILAAELFESEKVRKDQYGAVADAQKVQAGNEAGMSKAATAGSIAIATGCVAASALGQIYVAVPCVIGGALYTGAMKLMRR